MQPQHNVCYLLHFDAPISNLANPRGQASTTLATPIVSIVARWSI